MVNILPFEGYRFNEEKVGDLGKVMAPPYDTISQSEQEMLYDMSEYNVVRLHKGMRANDDTDAENCYTRAAAYLQKWIREDVLKKEEKPALYLYQQEVTYKNTVYKNQGVVGLLELQEPGEDILSCELSHQEAEEARYRLLEETRADYSMINCIYMEYEKDIMNFLNEISEHEKPDMEFETHENVVGESVVQRVWVITGEEQIAFMQKHLSGQTFYIADGQTRYEIALRYQKKCMEENPNHTGKESYNYIMTLFTNAFNDGLVQLPVHRMVRFKKPISEDFFIACAQDHFKVEKIIIDTASQDFIETIKKQVETARRETRFGFYCGGNYFYRMTFRNDKHIKELLPEASDAYRSLDVTILNHIIFEELLNLSPEQQAERVGYTTRLTNGIAEVRNGDYGCVFVMNHVHADQIRGIAMAHEKMPEKSIFIFPKAAAGIVIYKM